MMQTANALSSEKSSSSIEGLWLLLVENAGQLQAPEIEGRVPMMARAGDDQTYLLGFKNMSSARKFMQVSEVSAEPRMVVKSNKSDFLRIAQAAGVIGVLVDYDPATQKYATAAELY
jgi:hypothetical protein